MPGTDWCNIADYARRSSLPDPSTSRYASVSINPWVRTRWTYCAWLPTRTGSSWLNWADCSSCTTPAIRMHNALRSSLATRTIATAPARAKVVLRALTTTNLRTSLVKIKADNVLVGQWVETDSSVRWTTRQQGSHYCCLLYTSPSPRDATLSRMPSSA